MSKKAKKIDANQQSFDFDSPLQEYEDLRVKLLAGPEKPKHVESFEEACIEIAASIKTALRASGMSREQLVDGVNNYFGGRHRLSIHMLNHYLSKPLQYPIPTVMIYAIQNTTGSMETVSVLAQAEGAKVISGDEVRTLAVGKLDAAIAEMQRLKKEFRGIKR